MRGVPPRHDFSVKAFSTDLLSADRESSAVLYLHAPIVRAFVNRPCMRQ
jgi:hypothetical protein